MKPKIKKPKVTQLYFLPSIFTLTNVFFGFLSLTATFFGRYHMAALWIIIAAILDALDGLVARATKSSSEFGIQLDSLADAISFGAATSILMYFWGLKVLGPVGILFSFMFIVGSLLRLARYNIRTKSLPYRRYYQGLTVPSAALFLISLVIFQPAPIYEIGQAVFLAIVTLVVSMLMVSKLRYRNFVQFLVNRPIDMQNGLLMAVIIAGLLFRPKYFLLLFFTFNTLFGPLDFVVVRIKKKWQAKHQPKPKKDKMANQINSH